MRVRELVQQALGQDFVTEDGDPMSLELDPALSANEIEQFEASIPCPLPDDIRDLLRLCHYPPVLLYQSKTIDEFLVELFKLGSPPHRSLVDDVHEDRLFNVWRNNPGVLSHAECLDSGDNELGAFVPEWGDTFQYIDMREPSVGCGFSWGRYGPRTVIKRHGTLPIFAYEKKRGLFSRLISRITEVGN